MFQNRLNNFLDLTELEAMPDSFRKDILVHEGKVGIHTFEFVVPHVFTF